MYPTYHNSEHSSKIVNANCFDFIKTIPKDSVNLVLTDPPYVISKKTGFEHGTNKAYDRLKVNMDFGQWDKDFTVSDLENIVAEMYRVLRRGGTAIVFYDLWKITELSEAMKKAGFKQLRFIEWVKTNPVPINQSVNYLTNAREIAVLGVKGGKPTFNGKYDNGIYSFPIYHDKNRFHPTQKPIALFDALINKHSKKGDVVLDPFLGSGTTAISSYNTERQFLGCELNKTYFPKLVDRVKKIYEGEHPKHRNTKPSPKKRSPK